MERKLDIRFTGFHPPPWWLRWPWCFGRWSWEIYHPFMSLTEDKLPVLLKKKQKKNCGLPENAIGFHAVSTWANIQFIINSLFPRAYWSCAICKLAWVRSNSVHCTLQANNSEWAMEVQFVFQFNHPWKDFDTSICQLIYIGRTKLIMSTILRNIALLFWWRLLGSLHRLIWHLPVQRFSVGHQMCILSYWC